jgi:hypothetical protein
MIRIIFLSAILLFSLSLSAQKGLNLGLRACRITSQVSGATLPWGKVYESTDFDVRFRNSYGHGLVIRYGFNDAVGISTGLSQLRHKVRTQVTAPRSQLTCHGIVPMLEIPLLFTFRKVLTRDQRLSLNFQTGPSLAFWYPVEDMVAGGYSPGDFGNTNTSVNAFFQQDALAPGIQLGAGLQCNFDEYGSIYTGVSYTQMLTRSLRFYGGYESGYNKRDVELYIRGSYFCLDFIYFLNWYAFTGKKKYREAELVSRID